MVFLKWINKILNCELQNISLLADTFLFTSNIVDELQIDSYSARIIEIGVVAV